MPTYVYECKVCKHQFEKFQKMTDEPVDKCPECEGEVARVLFPPGIVFKGSGFHINDYPSSGSSVSGNPKRSSDAGESKSEAIAEATAAVKS
ncbi:MAG: FmdB family zinc ribbon protein [Armatimonadota bacterium]